MSRLRTALVHPVGYTLLLAIAAAFFLYSVGLRADALPFPPRAQFSDAVVSHWPSALFLQRTIQAGYFPWWRPGVMSGQPFAANPLNKVWYPPQWLALILPATLHLNVMLWLHLVIAGVGMRWLGRTQDLTIGVANVMGVVYMVAPRLIAAAGAGHLDVVYALAWLPWVLASVAHIVTPSDQSAVHLRWLRQAALFAIVMALCFLADIRIFVFALGLALAYALWTLITRFIATEPTQRQHFLRHQITPNLLALWVGAILALLLTAAQWMQLMEILPYATRLGLSPQVACVFSLEPLQLLGVILPRQPGSHEVILYSGLLLLISSFIGTNELIRAKRCGIALFWWLVIALAALYALGSNGFLWSTIVTIFPPLAWLRVPPRIWCLAIVALIVLAGHGLQALYAARLRLTPSRRAILVSVIGLALLAELLWTDVAYIVGKPQREWLDAYAPIAQALLADGVTRVYSPSYSFPQQAASYWKIPDFGGVDPLQLRGYIPEFEQATGTRVTGYTVTLPPLEGNDLMTVNQTAIIDAEKLGQWGVSHVVSAYPLTTMGLEQRAQIDGVYIYRNLFLVSSSDPLPESANPNCQQQPNSMFFPYLPGWYPSPIVDPAGEFVEIRDCYVPTTALPSLAVSGLGVLLSLGLLVMGDKRATADHHA